MKGNINNVVIKKQNENVCNLGHSKMRISFKKRVQLNLWNQNNYNWLWLEYC